MRKEKYSNTDFSSSCLPSSRARQFFFIMKNEWRHLLSLAVLMLVPASAYAAILVIEAIFFKSLSTDGERLLSFLIADFIKILVFLLASLVLSGAARVIRLMAYDEGLIFWSDFFSGIKENFKVFAICSIVYGLSSALPNLLAYIFSYAGFKGGGAEIIYALSIGLADLVVFPFCLFVMSQETTYELKVKDYFNNASRLYLKNFLYCFLFGLLPLGARLLENLSGLSAGLLSSLIGLIFLLFPLFFLLWYEFSLSIYDRFINKENFPSLYRKGLSPQGSQNNGK